MTSRDGLHWDRRFPQSFIRHGREKSHRHDRNNMTATAVVSTRSEIIHPCAWTEMLENPMANRIRRVVIIALFGSTTPSVAQLSPEDRVAEYQGRAEQLKAQKDYRAAADMMDMIVVLQREHDLILPAEFHFKYAQIALLAGRIGTAIYSATKYMQLAGKNGKNFQKARRLVDEANRQSLPPESEQASLVRPLVGLGITRLTDDYVDFKITENHILTENDSKYRSQLMTGALIKVHEFKNKNTFDLVANNDVRRTDRPSRSHCRGFPGCRGCSRSGGGHQGLPGRVEMDGGAASKRSPLPGFCPEPGLGHVRTPAVSTAATDR